MHQQVIAGDLDSVAYLEGDGSRSRELPQGVLAMRPQALRYLYAADRANDPAMANLSVSPVDRLPNIDPGPGRETSDEPDRDQGADARSLRC